MPCGAVPTLFGSEMPGNYNDTYGSTVTYLCLEGLWFGVGQFSWEMSCQANGEWSPHPPECKGIQLTNYICID